MSHNHVYAIALSHTPPGTPAATWSISVQPRKEKRLFHHDHNETTVFGSHMSTFRRRKSGELHGEEILVKILIGENDISSVTSKVEGVLKKVPDTAGPSEIWLQDAVVALQEAKLVDHFDVGGMVEFASETARKREAHDEHVDVEVDYLAEMKRTRSVEEMHEARDTALRQNKKGGSHHGFWISRPQPVGPRTRTVDSWERQDDPYAGLM